jgi:tRNA pseudouridine55 synthase
VTAPDGVLVVDKPAGPTSHDVVDRVRRALRTRRVGHTGTLDPFATGLLGVCIGRATRLSRFLMEGEKTYVAGVRFGFATSTDDFTGEPLGGPRPVRLDLATLAAAARRLVGELDQRPPAFSAKRVAGRKAYELARRGEAVAPASSRVSVREIAVTEWSGDVATLEVRCSAGTYVRALARDLGEILGTGAHLVALRRVRSGGLDLEDAVRWDEIGPDVRFRVRSLGSLLPELPEAVVNGEGVAAVQHGRPIEVRHVIASVEVPEGQRVRIRDQAGDLLALAVASSGARLLPDVVLIGV